MLKITIAIAAYNAERNITDILTSLINQNEESFTIHEIIVHCDACSDNTVKKVKEVTNNRINLIESKERRGFSKSLQTILGISSGDIIIVFNDDIKIIDNNLIKKITKSFKDEVNVGLVCGHPMPLPPRNFIEKAITTTYLSYDEMRNRMENKNNKFTCDGKILAFSKLFSDKIIFPKDSKKMGNVDSYLYFLCITNNFKYRYCSEAVVYYRNPSTISDYIKWTSRNNSNKKILEKQFGQIVNKEYKKPKNILLITSFKQFLKNPIGSLFVFVFRFFIKIKSSILSKTFNPIWGTISSSKDI